ncbi:GNAT family N-acetyltransferase [Aporhodopirellula aestuarii]|uniref:GNAT family N-acetyltransferase n=1 Tax=Aporhodopirellula aestuarii TaxID=2950107 RepID=A0ABT0U633_9BACT|nr:GNAT family N-acetyltransferase [Aporhodopirellula aestuarii]MCM2372345.1 GNAT family N-acetyltransferase [Aporhodopirellula aestuarii]
MPHKNQDSVTRKASGFQFAVAGRIEFLNADHWDKVTAGTSVFLSRRYLSSAQDEFSGEIVRDFAIIYDRVEPVAAVATQTFNVVGNQLVCDNSAVVQNLPEQWKRKSLSLLKRRIMMCGNVHTWGPHGVAIAAGQDHQRVWQGIADCLYRIRRANRLHGQVDYVIVKDLLESDPLDASALEPFRYRSMETEPNMVLSLNPKWQSTDDYLGSLTKRYRAAARKVKKPFDGDTLSVSPIQNLRNESERILELYKAVAAKADVCLFELSVTTLPRIAESLDDDFATIGIRENGLLIGFVTVIRDGETAIGFYLGMDYEANARLPVYHALLLAVIEQGIRWRCKRISFGRTALEAKSRLGCKPEAVHVWVRHRVPLLNFVVHQILKNVNHDEPPERNAFKDANNETLL